MTIIMNLHGELCGVHKIGSPGLNINRMMECIQRAKIKINKLSTLLKKELINADTIAKERLIVYANEKRNNVRDTMKNMMMIASLKPGESVTDFGQLTNKVIDTLPGLPSTKNNNSGSSSSSSSSSSDRNEREKNETPLFEGGITRNGKKGKGDFSSMNVEPISSLSVTLTENGERRIDEMNVDDDDERRKSPEIEEFSSMVQKIQKNIATGQSITSTSFTLKNNGSSSLKNAIKGKAKERLNKREEKKKKKKKKKLL
jgi:hypothetical protein